MMMLFAGEGWGEGMSRMVIDDEMWSRLEELFPKPKGRHGKDDRLFMEAICLDAPHWRYVCEYTIGFEVTLS
jgi:hypothetical protein